MPSRDCSLAQWLFRGTLLTFHQKHLAPRLQRMLCVSLSEPDPSKTPSVAWSLNAASVLPSLLWSSLFLLVAGVACVVRDISREQPYKNLRWDELPLGDACFSLLTTWRAQIILGWIQVGANPPVSAGSSCGEHSGSLAHQHSHVWHIVWQALQQTKCWKDALGKRTYPCSWLCAY